MHQSVDETIAGLAEIRADGEHAAVDARLDLALEERRIAELLTPRATLAHESDGASYAIVLRVHAEIPQQLQRVKRRGPGARDKRRATPMAIRSLQIEQAGAPPLLRHTRTFAPDGCVGLAGEIAHHLPPNRRIGVEQPIDDAHP